MVAQNNLHQVFAHALDGRGCTAGCAYISFSFRRKNERAELRKTAIVSGRYYAMDRDQLGTTAWPMALVNGVRKRTSADRA